MKTELSRLLEKANILSSDECWIWNGAISGGGRVGSIWFRGKSRSAHTASYILNVGQIPKGMCVCHRCDNPRCINPSHLFLATQADNLVDMRTKGRGVIPLGEHCGASKLKERDIFQIRKLKSEGFSSVEIGKKFGITRQSVNDINRHRTWKHL